MTARELLHALSHCTSEQLDMTVVLSTTVEVGVMNALSGGSGTLTSMTPASTFDEMILRDGSKRMVICS